MTKSLPAVVEAEKQYDAVMVRVEEYLHLYLEHLSYISLVPASGLEKKLKYVHCLRSVHNSK